MSRLFLRVAVSLYQTVSVFFACAVFAVFVASSAWLCVTALHYADALCGWPGVLGVYVFAALCVLVFVGKIMEAVAKVSD